MNGLSCDYREYTTEWRAIQHFHNLTICFHFSHLISCVEFFGLDILLSELWPQQCAKKRNIVTFSVFNHSCVCFRPAWEMMKAGAVFHSFCWVEVLLCLEAEGNVTDLLSLHLSASFWNLQPSGPLSILPIISVLLLLRLKPEAEAEMEIQNSEEKLGYFL